MKKLLVFAMFCLVATGSFLAAKGRVVKVTDGDSVTVLTEKGEILNVRLYGIDSPEYRQKGGKEAAEFARDLLLFSPVSLSVVDKDQYGRSVALVRLADGRVANEELVRAGHAWVYRAYCDLPACASWLVLERQAKKQGLGLWRDRNPAPPWKWRRANAKR